MSKLNLGGSAEEAVNRIGLDRSVRPGSIEEAGSQKTIGQIFLEGIYLGVSVGAHI